MKRCLCRWLSDASTAAIHNIGRKGAIGYTGYKGIVDAAAFGNAAVAAMATLTCISRSAGTAITGFIGVGVKCAIDCQICSRVVNAASVTVAAC